MSYSREGRNPFKRLVCREFILAVLILGCAVAISPVTSAGPSALGMIWQDIDHENMPGRAQIAASRSRTLILDRDALLEVLSLSPLERGGRRGVILELPLPEGGTGRFEIVEAPIMAPALAARYPQIRTYAGRGLDDPTATVRLDWTHKGFHASVLSTVGTFYIDPYSPDDLQYYISYWKREQVKKPGRPEIAEEILDDASKSSAVVGQTITSLGTHLRTYRTAVAASGEYTSYHGGTVPDGLAAIVTVVNRITQVFERDFAIRLELISDNDLIVYTDPATDPYTNDDLGAAIGENMSNLEAVIGSANFDLGHFFGTSGGGGAGFGICRENKAGGGTGLTDPIGDPFYIDYVAHEIGHQLHGSHTFDNCNGGSGDSSFEPGSGSTIMAYGGICGAPYDIQSNSNDYFHSYNIFDEISTNSTLGLGSICGSVIYTGNQPPIPQAGSGGFTIPRQTPFALTGSAVDPDGDSMTYAWEQLDVGNNTSPGDPLNPPFFRSWPATTDPTRFFPRLSELVNGTTAAGEVLPDVDMTVNFRFIARDNRAGGSGVASDMLSFDVTTAAGPFLVLQPSGTKSWTYNSPAPVVWDVAGTDVVPVDCSMVDILLSTDGGLTWPVTLASDESNDGSATVIVPNRPTTTGRVMVRCADNVFFDISDADLTIIGVPDYQVDTTPLSTTVCLGEDAEYSVAVDAVLGFSDAVTLSTSGDTGGTPGFASNPVTPSGSSLLTVANPVTGNYLFDIVGTEGATNHEVAVSLEVVSGPPGGPIALLPTNAAEDVAIATTLEWQAMAGATGYELQLGTDAGFTEPLVTAALVTNSYILPTLAYGTPYWWRVRAGNVCGEGEWAVFTFTTTQSALCSTAGFLIPDGDTVTGASQILDFGIGGTIEDLDISLHVLHSWVGDLDITLEHIDSGTSVRLIDQPNGNEFCNGDNIDAVLDDEAGSAINDACKETVPCIEGAFTPENPLSGFDGESITGSWKLTVHDNVEIDSGAVMLWCLLPTLATTPGESSGASYAPLRITGRDGVTGDISLSFETACGATGNNIYFGPLSAVGSAGWSGEDCAIGTGPIYDQFNPGTDSYFFVVVGNDGSAEGSYGNLRPPYGANSCGQTQTLMNSCD